MEGEGGQIMFVLYRFLLGYFLLALMVVSLFSLSLVFTATAAQRNISKLIPGSGGIVSIAEVHRAEAMISTIEDQAAPLRGDLLALRLRQGPAATAAVDVSKPAIASSGSEDGSAVSAVDAEVAALEQQVAAVDAAILAITQNLGGQNFRRVVGELHAIVVSTPFGLGVRIAEMHPQFLSIILALQMGGLGALLLVVRDYLRGPFSRDNEVTFALVTGRIVGGLGAAICLVTLAQSAVGALFTSIRVEGTDNGLLDSYTIAAIGLVGGFMGDGLAEGIQSRSLSFMKRTS